MKRFLIIQTAFIGDVVLMTPIIEKLHRFYPNAIIDCVVRKGNESLLKDHPHLRQVLVWNKKESKYKNLWTLLQNIRAEQYDTVINCQRFLATGLLASFSRGKQIIGFDKNPVAFLYHKKLPHEYGTTEKPIHEVHRNLSLIQDLTDDSFEMPKLYPSKEDKAPIPQSEKYICIAPTSVWFTKQYPAEKWIELINHLPQNYTIYLLGGPGDKVACESIKTATTHPKVVNQAGQLSLLASAALMQKAQMNYANDSAPIHLASAMNAPITAIFCSTIPKYGFTPLSDNARIVETQLDLDCRSCGIHGYKACPKGHFKCAEINVEQLIVNC